MRLEFFRCKSVFFLNIPWMQKTTDVGCFCRWTWMGKWVEAMLRMLTVSIREDKMGYLSLNKQNGRMLKLFLFAGVLQLKSVKPGHVVIRGPSSSLFLCSDSEGHLRGQVGTNLKHFKRLFIVSFSSLTNVQLFSCSGCVRGGRLLLQRTAAGRRIHPLP